MPKLVGLDMGTSTSAVAAMTRGQATILSLDERDRILPSVVGFVGKDVVVGSVAKRQIETNFEMTYTGLKRLLGRRADDPHVVEWASLVSYEILPGPDGEAYVRGPDRLYSPTELLSHIFKRLRETAQGVLNEPIDKCVLGVPAHFDALQKEALRQAARLGGLEPVKLLSEPTAAAVAYGVDRTTNRTLAVVDFGGGTLDVTILKITGQRFQELAKSGDQFLGGEDFDARIAEWLAAQFKAKHGIDLRADASARGRLRLEAERAKEMLSAQAEVPVRARYISNQGTHMLDLDEVLDREVLEEIVGDLVDRMRQPCRDALKKAKLDARDIDEVILVGGMTRMPLVRDTVAEIFGRVPAQKIDPVAAVALGCAMQAAAISGDMKSFALGETNPMAFAVQVGNGALAPIIRANARLPAREKRRFGLTDKDGEAAAIRIFHGAREIMRMVLNGLQPCKGEPLIDVELDVDEDGVLTAIATNVATKDKISHRIHAESGMSEAERAGLKDLEFEEEPA